MSMEILLRRADHYVQSAETAQAALELAAKEKFDVVITDIGLPDMSGDELMKELRDRYGLEGIAISGVWRASTRLQRSGADFLHHLTKPIKMEELRHLLAEVHIMKRPDALKLGARYAMSVLPLLGGVLFRVMIRQNVVTEVTFEGTNGGMDVVRLVLSIIELDQVSGALNAVIVRLAAFETTGPCKRQISPDQRRSFPSMRIRTAQAASDRGKLSSARITRRAARD